MNRHSRHHQITRQDVIDIVLGLLLLVFYSAATVALLWFFWGCAYLLEPRPSTTEQLSPATPVSLTK